MRSRFSYLDSAVTVFGCFLLIYLISLTSNFTGPHDSMTYLGMLNKPEHLWHPHHLLYHKATYHWLHFWKLIFPGAADYKIVESFSSLFGAGTVSIVYLFFRKRFNLPVLTSWLGTAVVAFSYGTWFYSVNVEVYASSLFFTTWCLYVITIKEWEAKHVWITALLHAFAVLFHQMNILFTPIVLYKILEQRKNIYAWKSIFWYGLTGLILVGGAYFFIGWFAEGKNNYNTWLAWVQGYTANNEYWRGLNWKTPILAGIGFSHTILGGHFIFKTGLEDGLESLLAAHSLDDEFFLVRNLSKEIGMLMFCLSLVLGAIVLVLLLKFIRRFKPIVKKQFFIVIPLLLYILVYSSYFLFWMPEILEFWLGQCIVFWLLLIGTYPLINRKFNLMLLALFTILFTVNYVSSIRPMQDPDNDIGYTRILKAREIATSDDLIIIQDPWLLQEFLEYYTSTRIEMVPDKPEMANELEAIAMKKLQQGKKVILFPARTTWHASKNKDFIPSFLERHQLRAKLVQEHLTEIWVIE